MPALRGSLTYTRLYVDGELPPSFHEPFLKGIRAKAMRPLDPQEPDPERAGLCRLGEPFETDLRESDVFFDDYLVLGLRIDRWAIPQSLLRAKLREAEAALLAQKGRERLSRKEKTELKEMLIMRLRRTTTPVTRTFDMVWSFDEKLVRFFSHSPKAIGHMIDLFYKVFSLRLIPESPHTLATRLGLDRDAEQAWAELTPSPFLLREQLFEVTP